MLSLPPYQTAITQKTGILSPLWHRWVSDLFAVLGVSIKLPAYTVATLPDPAQNIYGQIMVTDEVGGCVPAFSDGVSWRRVTDRAIVS